MSHSREQREAISAELRSNLALSGETAEQAAAAIDVPIDELEGVLSVTGASPEKVWMLRAHLEAVVRESGKTPHRYSTPAPEAQPSQTRWFGMLIKRQK